MLKASVDLPQLLWLCYLLLHTPFGLPSRNKRPPLDILNFLVTTFINQDKKFALIRVDEYGALSRYLEFMRTCHNMNTIVQTTGGDASSINSKSESPNKTFANITRDLLHK